MHEVDAGRDRAGGGGLGRGGEEGGGGEGGHQRFWRGEQGDSTECNYLDFSNFVGSTEFILYIFGGLWGAEHMHLHIRTKTQIRVCSWTIVKTSTFRKKGGAALFCFRLRYVFVLGLL